MFIWAGPLEVVCVLVMVGSQLTFPAAIAGIATLLLLIPFQVCATPHLASPQLPHTETFKTHSLTLLLPYSLPIMLSYSAV